MPLRIIKRTDSPYWTIRGTVRGVRIKESTGTADKKQAEEIRAKRETELLEAAIWGREQRPTAKTFADASVSYLEGGGAPRFLEPIVQHFGITPCEAIDQDAADAMARKLYPDARPATRNRQAYTPLLAVLRHAAKRKWCQLPIIERPDSGEERVRWLSPAEAKRLIAACSPHLRPLVVFLLHTGARAGEALWLDWAQVDLERAHVSFLKTKNGLARGVPLSADVVGVLSAMRHRQGPVFVTHQGTPYARPDPDDDADTSAGTRIKTAFRAAVRRSKLTDFHPHDCRHTWATWHYAANRDLGALQRLGGWRSERMVLRYAHVNVGELAGSIGNLPGLLPGAGKRPRRRKGDPRTARGL